MRIQTGILLFALLTGCKSNEVNKVLSQADSIHIQFAHREPNGLLKSTSNEKAIEMIARFVGSQERELPLECKVQPGGTILFYQKGKLYQVVIFTDLMQKCRYFVTKLNDKTIYTQVSDEAAAFLMALQEGRRSY